MKRSTNKLVSRIAAIIWFLCIMVQPAWTQSSIESGKEYLKNQLKQVETVLLANDQQDILDADIIEANLLVNLGDRYNDAIVTTIIFIKSKEQLIPFASFNELIKSPELIKVIAPQFKLKTEEDAVKLRSMFFALDNETRGKIFKKEGKWCFEKRSWFGKIEYYEVSTNSKGKPTSIKPMSEEIKIPNETMGSKSNIRFNKSSKVLSSKEKKQVRANLEKSIKSYKFDLKPLKFESFKSNLQFFDGKLKVSKTYNDGVVETTGYTFVLLKSKDAYSVAERKSNLPENKMFKDALSKNYSISNEKEAQTFEKLLDFIEPGSDEVKKHYRKENVWCFVRDKSFDNLEGILVLVSKDGTILHIDDSQNINDAAILKMKAHDPNFMLDYAFKLVAPTPNKIVLKGDEEAKVKITFNADAVNAMSAYIATILDGKMVGFSASTSMVSPFTDEIPGEALGKGNHIVQYMLLPSGSREQSQAFASVRIEVEVK